MIFTQETSEKFTSVIWTSYVLLSDYLMQTLKFYTVPVRLHDVINMKRPVDYFLPQKYDVISELCHS